MKQRRFLGMAALLGLLGLLATGCISDDTRGWTAPVAYEDDTQISSTTKGKLDGIDMREDPEPAWTGTLSFPLDEREGRLDADAISPTETPYRGDLLHVGSEIMRVRSLTVNGAQRILHVERGVAGTLAASHAADSEIAAFRRPWRFPDDWHIRQGSARSLGGVYGTPVIDADGVLYVGDYDGWVYAFRPDEVNLDASNDEGEPKVAVSNLDGRIIGGVALDEDESLLYVAAGDRMLAVSTERLKNALAAGGGEIDPESGFEFQAEDQIWAAPVVEGDSILVAGLDGNLYSLDKTSGAVQWSFASDAGFMTEPVVAGERILVGGFASTLYAVNLQSGEVDWSFEVGNWIFSSPRVEDGTAYFGDFDGILHAVDVDTGDPEWSMPLNHGEIRGSPAVFNELVVVGTDDGWLIGVDREQQQQVWEVNVGTDLRADLVVAGDEVLLAPDGCVTPIEGETRTYYRAVDPTNGTLKSVEAVC